MFSLLSSYPVFVHYIILYLLFTTIGGAVLDACGLKTGSFYYNVITSIFPILAIAIVIGTFSIKRKENILKTVNATKFNPLYIIPAILLAIGMLLGLGFLNNLIANTVLSLGGKVYYTDVKMTNFGEFILLVLTLAILPAVFEESLFRGLMLDGVKAMTTPIAICTISLCFSLYHGNIAQFVYQLIYGVGLSVLAYFSKSILPSITAHFINNFFILFFQFNSYN